MSMVKYKYFHAVIAAAKSGAGVLSLYSSNCSLVNPSRYASCLICFRPASPNTLPENSSVPKQSSSPLYPNTTVSLVIVLAPRFRGAASGAKVVEQCREFYDCETIAFEGQAAFSIVIFRINAFCFVALQSPGIFQQPPGQLASAGPAPCNVYPAARNQGRWPPV